MDRNVLSSKFFIYFAAITINLVDCPSFVIFNNFLKVQVFFESFPTISTNIVHSLRHMSLSCTSSLCVWSHAAAQAKLELERVRDLFAKVQNQHTSHKPKNVEFFLYLEQLCQRLHGGRLTCCKSGKDRTGMSVTLEECSVLRTNHHLASSSYHTTLATLRS